MHKVNFGKRLSELGYAKQRNKGKDYWMAQPIEGNGFIQDYEMIYSLVDKPSDSNEDSLAEKWYSQIRV